MFLKSTTPKYDGFHMPGEFEAHSGSWLLWPERKDNWRLDAKPAQQAFASVASSIAEFEPVTVGVSKDQYLNARKMLPENIRVIEISYNDSWIRDTGPTMVVNDKGVVRGIDWDFNAWGGLDGGLYYPWDQDVLVARKVIDIEKFDYYKANMILEGGSIHVDGEGTLLTTEECLLNPNRNPSLTKSKIESKLIEFLNVQKVIWLEKGVYNDETDGHVDNLCCFIRPGLIALNWTDDKSDPQYEISMNAFERLNSTEDAKSRKFEIHKIHQPGPLYLTKQEAEGLEIVEGSKQRNEGDRPPASYINFYIANGAIIAPVFNDRYDNEACEALNRLFPNRKIVQIYSREILIGGGNIHCIVSQIPC